VASSVEAESVAVSEEEKVSKLVVKIPSYEKGDKKRKRVGESTEVEEEVQMVKELIAPLGPRAECGGLLRRVGRESVVAEANPRFVDGGNPRHGFSRVSGRTDAWRQSPGASGGYGLRQRVGGSLIRGYGGRGRGRGGYFG